MRVSRLFGRTLREDPADADTPSHRLLVRAGLVDQLSAGIYSLLPLGLRVQRKLEQIIREELAAAGAQELLLPVLQPIEIWQQSGRDAAQGRQHLRLVAEHEPDAVRELERQYVERMGEKNRLQLLGRPARGVVEPERQRLDDHGLAP